VKEHAARPLLYERSCGVCERCRAARAVEAHHRQNRSQGGTWALSNLLHLCGSCHRWCTVNPAAAHELGGWSVPRALDPADVLVQLGQWPGRWARLLDDGMIELHDERTAA
jgi:hypothetical protein